MHTCTCTVQHFVALRQEDNRLRKEKVKGCGKVGVALATPPLSQTELLQVRDNRKKLEANIESRQTK